MGDDTYRTVAGAARVSFRIQGSEFVGHAAPASSVSMAEAVLDDIRGDHPDATHIVPAHRIRIGDADPGGYYLEERSNDDGEPAGSAGRPVLNVLRQRSLENVVGVVVRYFGGTELGVGRLTRAYSRGAADAVDAAGIVDREPHESFVAVVEYDDSGTVRGILESDGVSFESSYAAMVSFEVTVPTTTADELRDRLRSATSGRVEIEKV